MSGTINALERLFRHHAMGLLRVFDFQSHTDITITRIMVHTTFVAQWGKRCFVVAVKYSELKLSNIIKPISVYLVLVHDETIY